MKFETGSFQEMYIQRNIFLDELLQGFRVHAVVALLGPRQCGKTTIANIYSNKIRQQDIPVKIFDLEDPNHLRQLENPKLALEPLKGLIVIDEIQNKPELFPLLRVLVDKNKGTQQYLILGSASRELIKQSSETLAGRVAFIELTPFNSIEINNLNYLWLKGGYPISYLAESEEDSFNWRKNYITTFLEKDIPNLGINIPANSLRKFWNLLAHYHGNILNSSELGRALGVSHTTVKKYLEILVGTFMIRELKPWHENISKRQVKQSKIYFRDSGIYHYFLGIIHQDDLQATPKIGASWEGFALEETIRLLNIDAEDCYFWATHQGAELDLLITKYGRKIGFEYKYQDAPKITKSMQIAIDSLNLDKLYVVYPGKDNYKLGDIIEVININTVSELSL